MGGVGVDHLRAVTDGPSGVSSLNCTVHLASIPMARECNTPLIIL